MPRLALKVDAYPNGCSYKTLFNGATDPCSTDDGVTPVNEVSAAKDLGTVRFFVGGGWKLVSGLHLIG